MKNKKIEWKVLIISFVIVYLVAFVGSLFTSGNTSGDWYDSVRPEITPPNYIFPIVWNILFFLIALSLYFAWINSKNDSQKIKIGIVFGVNFVLNIFWSYLYFYLKRPDFSLIEIFVLWISILSMIFVSYRISKKSAYLLIPYFLWVSFACVLNYLSVF